MPSATEQKSSRLRAQLERWNRKLHFYSGLFLLFFMWLFAFTGLILNHPTWSFQESWNNRKEQNYERDISSPGPATKSALELAHEIQRQLGIPGEVLLTTTRTDTALFDFQLRRPGHFYFMKADLARNKVAVRQVDVNLWGVMKVLHTFTGTPGEFDNKRRDWALTTVWAYSMDAVAIGLIFMVLSSVYMWYELPQKRLPGAIALALGSLTCGLFCFGLRWFF
jgi:hypothetical protein